MSKQEEIEKTMLESVGVYLSEEYTKGLVNHLLLQLHLQGVAIKVEDDSFVAECLRDSWEEIKQDMKEAGYTKWKSLKEA